MRYVLLLIMSVLLLTGCTPAEAYQDRKAAQATLDQADALVYGVVGDDDPSYEVGGRIYTDTQVKVIRGRGVKPDTLILLRRRGGSIPVPGTTTERLQHVDYLYDFPARGHEVFLVLRAVGGKFEILDTMPVNDGRGPGGRPSYAVYARALSELP